MILPTTRRDATHRRGMLLLLVLSILSLFIVVGGVGILLALRARESARAFAAGSAAQAGSASLARAQLDEALLRLVRGSNPATAVTESLLEDKYGTSQSGSATAVTAGATSPLIAVTVTGLDLTNPAAVAGRVLTFVPQVSDTTGPTSYRIARADKGTATSGTVWLASVKPTTPLPPPSLLPCEVVLNGREFTDQGKNEPYDAFDDKNPFLSWPVVANSTVTSVQRPAFGTAGQPCNVDNDGDGIPDGVWLTDALPRQRTPTGGELSFDVSYLVLDLDGRINLNAHGSYVRAQVNPATQYPSTASGVPTGLGYGPVDVDAALLVSTAAEFSGGTIPALWSRLLNGGTVSPPNALVSSTSQWRPAPRAETTQLGRYGASTGPGSATIISGTNPLNPDFWVLNSSTAASSVPPNSPTDLKGRLRVFTSGNNPPVLMFARPSPAWVTTGTDTDDVRGAGANAQPYALRLDPDAPRATGTSAFDAIYTLGELERVLRPFDADAAALPPRLAAVLDDQAERLRMSVTTDSWDTPAITGSTSQQIAASVTAGDPNSVHSPDVVAGLRFDVNRPIATSTAARQEYFRHLYSLLMAINVPSGTAAQWAANVIEFRDSDSSMAWYPYDTNPLDGVWTTGTGVWGTERPELAITSATITGSTVTVNFYRPWSAQLLAGASTTASGSTEAIDGSLGNRAANTLNLTGSSGVDPVWQLSVGGTTVGLGTLVASATAVAANTAVGPATLTVSGSATQVQLRRLANPAAARDTNSANATYNDYVTVHQVSLPQASRTVSRWLHWPNRDLVNHGELLAVPAAGPASVAEALFAESSESSVARSYPLVLDATIVPSRFSGANVSVASPATMLAGVGMQNFMYGQFSRWREAGRVNVNTILPNAGNTAGHLDNAVWKALVGRTDVTNPVTSAAYAPVKSDRELLTGAMAAALDRTGADSASSFLRRASVIRLASTATPRSHVFAVWITLRINDSGAAGTPQYARLFAIVDRSVPVGYAAGRTLNVRETVRLVRYVR